MPVFDWSTMKNLSIGDIAALYGVDVSDLAEMFGADAGMTLHDVKNERGITKYEIQGIIEDAYAQYNGIVYDVPEPQRISYSLLLQDYVYIVLVAAGSILFALKKYKFRLVLLGLSLLYFGFYLKGCMCQLGVFANFFIFDTIELHWFVLLVVPVVSTLLVGRSFCGWVCFFGTIQEYLFEARKRVFPFKTRRKLPSWLSYSKFVVLGLILYFAIVSSRVVFCDYDPFFYIIYRMFSLDTLGVLTVLLVAGSLFIERPFCRYACPMGAVLMAADAVALNRVRVAEPSCNACRLCTRVCPMNRDLVNGKGECINCGKCFETCRKDALYYGKKKRA
jgi:polyferredoxin